MPGTRGRAAAVDPAQGGSDNNNDNLNDNDKVLPSSFDEYTLGIMNDLKLTLDKHENKLRSRASEQESVVREALAGHRRKARELHQELRQTFSPSPLCQNEEKDKSDGYLLQLDLLDLVPAAIIDEGSKASLRSLAEVCERVLSQFRRRVTSCQHPFLVNLGLLRLYAMERHSSQIDRESQDSDSRGGAQDDVFLAEARHFLRFSDDVYDRDGLYLAPGDVMASQLQREGVGYMVFLDHLTDVSAL